MAGQVTKDGALVTSGRIQFYPETGRPASGEIDSEGRYILTTRESGDGAKPGNYVVTITSRQAAEEEGPVYKSYEDEMRGIPADAGANATNSKPKRARWLVPKRYSNRATSELIAVVGDGEDINFQVHSKR